MNWYRVKGRKRMSTAAVPSNSTTLAERPRAVQNSARAAEHDEQQAIGFAEAFGAALASARVEVSGWDSRKNARLAGQMFDAPADPSKQRRADVLKANESDHSLSRDPRLDQTSVAARRAAPESSSAYEAAHVKDGRGGGRESGVSPESTSVKFESGSTAPGSQASVRIAGGAEARDSSGTTASRGAGNAASQGQRVEAATTSLGTEVAAAAAPKAAGSVQGGVSSNPAESVGRVLGAPRVGEVESSRALTPGQSAQGQAGTRGRGESSPTRSGRADSQAPSSATNRSEKPAATEPTEFDRLVRSLQVLKGGRQSQARMVLDPPELGRMWVSVRMDGDQLQLDVRTETEAARQLVGERIQALRDALRRHGIDVQRLGLSAAVAAEESDNTLGQRSPAGDARVVRRSDVRAGSESARGGGMVAARRDQQMDEGPFAERRLDVSI